MRRVAIMAILLLAVSIFVGAGNSTPVHAEESAPEQTTQGEGKKDIPEPKIVKVKSGDSLSKLAKRNHTNYKRIFYANTKIKDPDLIYPGQKLKVPHPDAKLKKRAIPGDAPAVTEHKSYSAPKPTYQPQARSIAPSVAGGSVWDRLAACESGGNWAINTGNGYYGGLQFSLGSWRGVGGKGYPHQASREEQIYRGKLLQASGGWGHWPACSAKLGLR